MHSSSVSPSDEIEMVLKFWFEDCQPKDWWQKSETFDALISGRFGGLLLRAAACELSPWRASAAGRLAEVIVLDQFSRNIYRDTPRAFAQDPLALALAQEAVAAGADRELEPQQRAFLYMPYMHSESLLIHDEAMRLFSTEGMADNLDFERRHRDIIARFGRYPHRNAILGRDSSDEEVAFLQQPGSSF